MPANRNPNTRSGSTTFAWRRVKIASAPQASSRSGPSGLHSALVARRDPRKPLTVTIVYRGGSECWWELRARGMVVRRPGHLQLHDVLSELQGRS